MNGSACSYGDFKEEAAHGYSSSYYTLNLICTKEWVMSNSPANFVEIKNSKTDLPVPVINGVHLHSIYNPEREAEGFITASEEQLKKGNRILVFGLGMGYHLAKLESRLKSLYQNDYQVFVIEPNRDLVSKWKELRPNILSPQIKVVNKDDVKGYYQDKELVEFLATRPTILPHPASFQLNETFFKTFMTYHYPTAIKESVPFINNVEFKNYLDNEDPDQSTDELFASVKSKGFVHGHDFLVLALDEIVNGGQR